MMDKLQNAARFRIVCATCVGLQRRSVILGGLDDVVHFQDHFAYLRCQEHLLLLAAECLENVLLFHVIGAHIVAVYAQVGIALLELPRLDLGQALDRLQARVLSQGQRDAIQCICRRQTKPELQSGHVNPSHDEDMRFGSKQSLQMPHTRLMRSTPAKSSRCLSCSQFCQLGKACTPPAIRAHCAIFSTHLQRPPHCNAGPCRGAEGEAHLAPDLQAMAASDLLYHPNSCPVWPHPTCKGAHGVLLHAHHLIGSSLHCQGTGNLG